MKTYLCLIVDDTEIDAFVLNELLNQLPLMKQIDVCQSAAEASSLLFQKKYDVVFLDIRLPDQSGFEWLRSLPPPCPPFIITSAYPEYAIDGYDFNVADFLMKPVSLSRLNRAIHRALAVQITHRSVIDRDSIFLHVDRRIQQFRYDDILFAEAQAASVKIETIQHGTSVVNESISILHDQLPPHRFIRIHRSYIVNVQKITAIDHKYVWANTVRLPIGNFYRESLRQLLHTAEK